MFLLYNRWWKYFVFKTIEAEKVRFMGCGHIPTVLVFRVTHLYGRLQNHINYTQQLYSSGGFSFPSLHCPKANKPFRLKVFLHSKMYILKFNAFGYKFAVQSFLSPCSASCFYVVNVIGNMDWVLFFCKPLSWRYAREQTPVRQVYNLCEGARYALHGLITWTASVPTVSAFAFTDSSGNSYLGCFFLNELSCFLLQSCEYFNTLFFPPITGLLNDSYLAGDWEGDWNTPPLSGNILQSLQSVSSVNNTAGEFTIWIDTLYYHFS